MVPCRLGALWCVDLCRNTIGGPVVASLYFLTIIVFNLFSLSGLPVSLCPSVSAGAVVMVATCPKTDTSSVRGGIAHPLRGALGTIDGLGRVASHSSRGVSLVALRFRFNGSVSILAGSMHSGLSVMDSRLPSSIRGPVVFGFDASVVPVMLLSIRTGRDRSTLCGVLSSHIIGPLTHVPNINAMSVDNTPRHRVRMCYSPGGLRTCGLDVRAVDSVVKTRGGGVPKNGFSVNDRACSLHMRKRFSSSHRLTSMIINARGKTGVFLHSITHVISAMRRHTRRACGGNIRKTVVIIRGRSNTGSMRVSHGMRRTLPHLRGGLPDSIGLKIVISASSGVLGAVSDLTRAMVCTLLFIIVIIFLFLKH